MLETGREGEEKVLEVEIGGGPFWRKEILGKKGKDGKFRIPEWHIYNEF